MIKSGNNFYWVDDNSQPLTLSDTSGNPQRDFIFFNGQRVAMYVFSNNDPYYYLSDAIGSTSVISSGDGKVIEWDADYYPYGGSQVYTSKLTNYYQFTGYEKDFETNNYYAVNRYQSSVLGRFFSPDAIQGDINNPQTWNRYAYALNNPVKLVDPFGLDSTVWVYGSVDPVPTELIDLWLGGIDLGAGSSTDGTDGGGGGGATQAALGRKDQRKYENLRAKALKDVLNPDCIAFCLSNGISVADLISALANQQAFNGSQSTITQAAAYTGITSPADTVAYGFKHPPNGYIVNAAASISGPPTVYFRQGGFLSSIFGNGSITEATIEHEALHNATGSGDYSLEVQLGLPTGGPSDVITQDLKDHKCAH